MVTGIVATKVIELGLPLAKQAGAISLQFLEGGLTAVKENNSELISLSKNISIIDNDLSLPKSFSNNQYKLINQEIKDDLDIIKGQNEILFLSNSIEYFVKSHLTRTGIDRGISYALQYDITAVINHLKQHDGIRFPGYLLHQCTSLAETIKEYNIFYDSILNSGYVHDWSSEKAKDLLARKFGVEERNSMVTSYIPFEYQIPWKRENLLSETDEKSSWKNMFEFTSGTEINNEAHDALYILSNELIANENLEYLISTKIKTMPCNTLLIKSPEATCGKAYAPELAHV